MAKRRYYRSGIVRWYDDREHYHREDGPAAVYVDGTQYWYRHDRFHFAHGPSILYADLLVWYDKGEHLRRREPYG